MAFAGYPLVVEERVIGVMAMFSREALSESTLHAMSLVADHIALGIQRKLARTVLAAETGTPHARASGGADGRL